MVGREIGGRGRATDRREGSPQALSLSIPLYDFPFEMEKEKLVLLQRSSKAERQI